MCTKAGAKWYSSAGVVRKRDVMSMDWSSRSFDIIRLTWSEAHVVLTVAISQLKGFGVDTQMLICAQSIKTDVADDIAACHLFFCLYV